MKKLLKVGKITSPQGIRGEVKVYPLTDYKERFEELEWVYIENEKDQKVKIEKVKYKGNMVILKLDCIKDRNMAETFRNKFLSVDREHARQLPEDAYFIKDLIGTEVYIKEDQLIGKVKDVIQNTAQDLYEIEKIDSKKVFYVPAVKAFIKEIDIENKKMIITPIEGLIE